MLKSKKIKNLFDKQFKRGFAIKISQPSTQSQSNLSSNNITHIHGTGYSGLTAGKMKKR
jgi:hypothetical protein